MAAPDVVVIGGGICGVATATFLAEAGARVTLVEREALAAGASGRNSGVIQQPFDPALVPLYTESLAHYRALADAVPEAGFRLPEEPAGLLLVSHHEAVVRGRAEQLRALLPDLATQVLGGADLQAREPAMAPGVWALHAPIGYPVVPSAPTYAWAARADRAGVAIRLGRAAVPAFDGGRCVAVDVADDRIAAGAVVVAAGPWTSALVDPAGGWRPILPSWGVVVETALARPPRHVLEEAAMDEALGVEALADAATVEHAAASDELRPETSVVTAAGVSAVGSTFLPDEPDLEAWTEPILRRATTFVPDLLDAPIRETRACARPQSIDGRALIGRVTWRDGLFVCAGHGPWGITTGPASARQVADLVLGRPVEIDPAFDPARFGSP
ncbi:MAG: FAD-binding oxidoreductase [Chloroflexi bacterium]|nr:FAD-binding oxidoreductase [Chloroflexota bacterium]